MSTQTVRTLLETRVFTWAQSNSYPISLEGYSFEKPVDGIWLECFLLPNRNLNREVSGVHHTKLGMFQVNVWGPRGFGMVAIEQVAEQVASLYPIVPKQEISIEKTPTVERSFSDDSGWIIVPVLIPYRYEE